MRNLLVGVVLGIVLTSAATWAELNLDPRVPNKPSPFQNQQQQQLDRMEQQNQQILQNQRRKSVNPC
jgi:hypothetical protein